jgi:hypothetical protein
MHYISFGKLKNAFRTWTEELQKYAEQLNAKREEIVRKIAVSVMGKEQFAFMLWKNWIKRELHEEMLMKKMVDKMLRSAGLMVYNLFTRWKMDTFTDIERKREMRKNAKLNACFECLDKKHRNHLKTGFTKLAGESMNTATR